MSPAAEMDRIEERATEWVVRRDAGMDADQQREFETWLESDPRHLAAFAEIDAALAALHRPRKLGLQKIVVNNVANWEGEQRDAAVRHRRRFIRSMVGLAASLVLGLGVYAVVQHSPAPPPSVATVRPRPEQRRLPDGSLVELNAKSDIAVDYTPARRGIRLLRGEAHFEVTKDPARPFVVSAGKVEVCAVGTAFAVRMEPGGVDVLVTEGRVAVATAANPAMPRGGTVPPVYVSAGRRLVVPNDIPLASSDAAERVTPVEMAAALAWRGARFEFTNAPLAEAVELFNQKSTVKLSLGDSSLAQIRVSGIYWANNPDGFAKLIESSLDIAYTRDGPDHIVLHRRN